MIEISEFEEIDEADENENENYNKLYAGPIGNLLKKVKYSINSYIYFKKYIN